MKHSPALLVAVFALTLPSLAGAAQTLFRYKDENGVTVLNNVLPPNVVPRGYEIVNEYGQVVEVVPPAKTKAEIEAEKQAQKRAKQEEKERKEKAKRDAMLLASFTSMEDITRARDNQLAAIDVTISVSEGNIARLKGQLENLQAHAANLERRGQAIPEPVNKDIAETLRQIKESEGFIADKRGEQDQLRKRFEEDIIRFQELHAARLLSSRGKSADGEPLPPQDHGLYECKGRELCDKVWALAQLYAREHATTRLEIVTNSIILTAEPKKDSDVSLTFSRVPGKGEKEQIVVEVRCAKGESGQLLCPANKLSGIRDGFNNYVNSRLKT